MAVVSMSVTPAAGTCVEVLPILPWCLDSSILANVFGATPAEDERRGSDRVFNVMTGGR